LPQQWCGILLKSSWLGLCSISDVQWTVHYPQSGNLNSRSAVKHFLPNKPGLAEAYNSRSAAKHFLPNKPGLAEAYNSRSAAKHS
jgi:hypothetical protein